MNGVVLDLPVPPSVNGSARHLHVWRRQALEEIARQTAPVFLQGRLAVAIELPRRIPGRRRGDLDNYMKPLIDLLWRSRVIADDSQIDWLLIRWTDVKVARVIVSGIKGGKVAPIEEVFAE